MDIKATVAVYPEEGEFPRIARELLAVADSPRDVLTVSNPRMGFLVPEDLFERFQAAEQERWEQADLVEHPEAVVPQAELPKKRGRPRKNPLPAQEVEEQ